MAAIANIVLTDAASPTPIAHTFVPSLVGLQPGSHMLGKWQDITVNDGIPVGYWTIESDFQQPVNQRPDTYRMKLKIRTPVLEVVSNSTVTGIAPAPSIAYTPEVSVEFVIPRRSVAVDRENLRVLMAELLTETVVEQMVEQLSPPF